MDKDEFLYIIDQAKSRKSRFLPLVEELHERACACANSIQENPYWVSDIITGCVLSELSQHYPIRLDIGTFTGFSASCMALSYDGIVHTFDVHNFDPKVWERTDLARFIRSLPSPCIKPHSLDMPPGISEDILAPVGDCRYGLIYIDESHWDIVVKIHMERCLNNIETDGIILFHDACLSSVRRCAELYTDVFTPLEGKRVLAAYSPSW